MAEKKREKGVGLLVKRWTENVLFGLFGLMVIVVFANVIARYVFRSALTSSEEIARICFVWLVFIGAVLALFENEHIGFDALVKVLPARCRSWVTLVGNMAMTMALALVTVYGVILCRTNLGWPSPATGISYGIIGAVVPISTGAMALLLAVRTVVLLRKKFGGDV